jgi:hypothetical protein
MLYKTTSLLLLLLLFVSCSNNSKDECIGDPQFDVGFYKTEHGQKFSGELINLGFVEHNESFFVNEHLSLNIEVTKTSFRISITNLAEELSHNQIPAECDSVLKIFGIVRTNIRWALGDSFEGKMNVGHDDQWLFETSYVGEIFVLNAQRYSNAKRAFEINRIKTDLVARLPEYELIRIEFRLSDRIEIIRLHDVDSKNLLKSLITNNVLETPVITDFEDNCKIVLADNGNELVVKYCFLSCEAKFAQDNKTVCRMVILSEFKEELFAAGKQIQGLRDQF